MVERLVDIVIAMECLCSHHLSSGLRSCSHNSVAAAADAAAAVIDIRCYTDVEATGQLTVPWFPPNRLPRKPPDC